MKYVSTRNKNIFCGAAEAIVAGIAPDGGLYTPEDIPLFKDGDIANLCALSYPERAAFIMSLYLEDFSARELSSFAASAYKAESFDTTRIIELKKMSDRDYLLELWHGPTAAFKDMALQILPHLLTASLEKTKEKRTACILVATSGDTGKAALEGFADVDHTKIVVFYPSDGVSAVQKLQMVSQTGKNVGVCAVNGNFDDAQNGVKAIFADEKIRDRLNENSMLLSSANSINWGRLVPQIVYYVSAYCELVNRGEIKSGEAVNICVPTGNFGNILAAYFAFRMGLPVGRFICASNQNDVLAEFFTDTGYYNANRPFYNTASPSMDILVSSNLERLLFYVSGGNSDLVAGCMKNLKDKGEYMVWGDARKTLKSLFSGGSASEEDSAKTIRQIYDGCGILCDPHTAVAVHVANKYREETSDQTKTIIASTASPFKFCKSVLEALGIKTGNDGPELFEVLKNKTGQQPPESLQRLKSAEVRFTGSVSKSNMGDALFELLDI